VDEAVQVAALDRHGQRVVHVDELQC
jgi:hypothetical protein